MSVPENLDLDEDSFLALCSRGRSKSFRGTFAEGQAVTAKCDGKEQPAVVAKAGRRSWVAKKT